MAKMYRVVVSENQDRYPNRTFIDFAAAQIGNDNYSTHEIILKMRQTINPDVHCLTDGLLLIDNGDGDIKFRMEMVTNARLREYQRNTLEKYREQIISSFKQMRAAGRHETLKADNYNMAEIFDFYSHSAEETHRSAKENILREKSKYYRDLEERRKDLLERRHSRYDERADYDIKRLQTLKDRYL